MDLQHVSKYWNCDAVIKIYINLLWEENERDLLGDSADVLGKYLFCSIIAVYKMYGFVQDFSLKYSIVSTLRGWKFFSKSRQHPLTWAKANEQLIFNLRDNLEAGEHIWESLSLLGCYCFTHFDMPCIAKCFPPKHWSRDAQTWHLIKNTASFIWSGGLFSWGIKRSKRILNCQSYRYEFRSQTLWS